VRTPEWATLVRLPIGRAGGGHGARPARLAGELGVPPRSPWVSLASAAPHDLPGRDAIVTTLDVIAREFDPLAVSFVGNDAAGKIRWSVVQATGLTAATLSEEAARWIPRVETSDPLRPAALASLPGRVVTLRDLPDERRSGLDEPGLRQVYEQMGGANDTRVPIRDGDRLVATVSLWRRVPSAAWSDSQLRLLEALQPVVELAYLSARRSAFDFDARLPATLTRRQREVARLVATGATNVEIAQALVVSPNTAKSHTRAVLAKLGVASRRELALQLTRGAHPRMASSAALGAFPPSARLEGDEPARGILAHTLRWAAQRTGAVAGGCMLFSSRMETVADACAVAVPRQRLNVDAVRRIQRELLPAPAATRILRRLFPAAARTVVARPDRQSDSRLGERLRGAGLTSPTFALLRLRGRVAGVVWLAHDAFDPPDPHESGRALRTLHPLLELAFGPVLARELPRLAARRNLAHCGLSEREWEIARMAIAGETNGEIAAALGVSVSTVKNHMTRILEKCGVRSRMELISLLDDASQPVQSLV
jgi:DNA-binding NarL/FixJ family response regulator